jgi:hypothetical protein
MLAASAGTIWNCPQPGHSRSCGLVTGWERVTPVALMKDAPLEWRAPSKENSQRI